VSLKEKWEEYRRQKVSAANVCEAYRQIEEAEEIAEKRAFYAGAEAVLGQVDSNVGQEPWEIMAEIDHFKAGKVCEVPRGNKL